MLRNLTEFKSIIQGVESYFHFDQNCPISIAKESLFECLKWIGQIEDQIKAQQEANKSIENVHIESVPENNLEEKKEEEVINEQPAE